MGAREGIVESFGQAAQELERAAARCRISAKRFEVHDVPRGCAHAFASEDHILKANKLIEANAEVHSGFALINE
jgi:hypothetical protein